MTDFPSFPEQLKNTTEFIFDVFGNAIAKHEIFVSTEEKESRYQICESCEFFELSSQRCRKCGCYLQKKVQFTSAKCPISKW